MLTRAYSTFSVKSVDPERRVISGIATTPEADRLGDVIEPLGVQFKNPLPLLLYHDSKRPVGHATFKKPTKHGIEFEAKIPTIDEPGTLRDRLNEAWDSVKSGLVGGISVGFRSIEQAFKDDGGIHFLKTEVVELSLVVIPANAACTILAIKELDLAATGPNPPGATGILPVVRAGKSASSMTVPEQITQFENTRAAKAARMNELMSKAAETGSTLDAAQSEEHDTLAGEVASIDLHLKRLRDMEKLNIAAATPITKTTDIVAASEMRGGNNPVIQVKANLPKGTSFVRYVGAVVQAKGNLREAAQIAHERWSDSTPEVELYLKAAVAAGTTVAATWALPLVPTAQQVTGEFFELIRAKTVVNRLTALRKVPFNVAVPAQTAGGAYGWVGQGLAKPVTSLAFSTVTLGMAKIAGIVVITEELARLSSPSAEDTVRTDMVAGVATFMDTQFMDPAVAAVANVNPASITNAIAPIASTGATPDNAKTDIKALVATFVAAHLSLENAVLIMSEANAFALGIAVNALGQPMFPGMGQAGGTIMGIPVITSQSATTKIILVDQRSILYADEGGTTIDVSREATLQMDGAPMVPDATTVYRSLWQDNLIALRVERHCTWVRGRLTGVAHTSGAAYV